jgi:hypothetical protein
MPLFLIFIIFFNNHSHSTIIHSFIPHHSPRPVFGGAETKIELGPALQQADALQTEPRHALSKFCLGHSQIFPPSLW